MNKEITRRLLPLAALLLASVVGLAGCEPKGPAEKAGQKVDNAAQGVKDAVSPPGPGEKAGRNLDKAVNP